LAKKDSSGPDQGRVKFRVIEFEVDGANSTLVEGIRNLAATITRGNAGNGRAVHQEPKIAAGALAAPSPEVVEDGEEDGAAFPAAATPRVRAKRTVSSPEILDLDLSSGDMPLKKFFEQKNPDSDAKRYLVIAYWFKHYGSAQNVTLHHIHTAYRHLKLNTPKDPGQPLRDLKSKNQWLNKAEGKGTYTINHIGENTVNEMPQG
jgi:hypothetical protein